MTTFERLSLLFAGAQTLIFLASALFIAWQLRQFRSGLNYQTYHRQVDQFSRVSQLLIDKPHLNALFTEPEPGQEPAADIQKDCYNYLALSLGCMEPR